MVPVAHIPHRLQLLSCFLGVHLDFVATHHVIRRVDLKFFNNGFPLMLQDLTRLSSLVFSPFFLASCSFGFSAGLRSGKCLQREFHQRIWHDFYDEKHVGLLKLQQYLVK